MVRLDVGLQIATYTGRGEPMHSDVAISCSKFETELGTYPN